MRIYNAIYKMVIYNYANITKGIHNRLTTILYIDSICPNAIMVSLKGTVLFNGTDNLKLSQTE